MELRRRSNDEHYSACNVILSARKDAVLVATMGSMVAMDTLGAQQPRVSSVPLMGGAPGLGLGLALAHPERKVIVWMEMPVF